MTKTGESSGNVHRLSHTFLSVNAKANGLQVANDL